MTITRGDARMGMIATVAAVLASIGDLLLLVVANGARSIGGWPRDSMLVAGFYLGVLSIPLYALGYRQASGALPEPYARIVTVLGACGAVVGATIHGVTAVALQAQASGIEGVGRDADPFGGLTFFAAYLVPLWTIATVAVLGASVAFAVPIARGESTHARWIAAASPAALVVVIGACAGLSSWLRAIVAPAAPNLAHAAFFALMVARRGSASGRRPAAHASTLQP